MARLEEAGSAQRHSLSVETIRDQQLHNQHMKTSPLFQTFDSMLGLLIANRTTCIHGKVNFWDERIGPGVSYCPAMRAYSVS